VATTTIWGNITEQIVRCANGGQVQTLIPVGADPHDYSPSSSAVAQMVNANLVVANGLELEEGLEGSLESAAADGATVFFVAPELNPVTYAEEHAEGEAKDEAAGVPDEVSAESATAEDDHSDEEHSHGGEDPHVWLDMNRAAAGASLIGAQLAERTGEATYATCGDEVASDIESVNAEVTAILDSVPDDRRILVTDHDAFEYFASTYGFDIAGVVIPGGSTLGDPSSAELAALAQTITDSGVPAIFANTADPQALSEALAQEAGGVQVVELYVGSIGEPGTPADSYQGMMRVNAQRIADALRG